MTYTTRDIQARVAALGFDPGAIDGLRGPNTEAAVQEALKASGAKRPDDLFHPSGLHRIILHWTAGATGVIELEREYYHFLIDHAGKVIPGRFRPEANAKIEGGLYAAHTRALNTGSIGVALDGMAGAQESPFAAGGHPINTAQLKAMAVLVADLCETYMIPISEYSVLTHAEVQPTLGVWQRNKWDITWLPGMPGPGTPRGVGDTLRDMVREAAGEGPQAKPAATDDRAVSLIRALDAMIDDYLKGD